MRWPLGDPVAGWPTTNGSGPIDSTPSVVNADGQASSILVGSGNDGDPTTGGYQAYGPSGQEEWFAAPVNPPSDSSPSVGVEAGISIGTLQGQTAAVAGSLGQVSYARNAANGSPLTGWPFLNTDSTHSTAALADLYGTGQNEIIVGGDQTGGYRRRPGLHERRAPPDPDSIGQSDLSSQHQPGRRLLTGRGRLPFWRGHR